MNTRSTRLVLVAIILALSGCCRPATEFQVAKWERRHKFESPRQFWGLHIFTNKNKPIKIKYKK